MAINPMPKVYLFIPVVVFEISGLIHCNFKGDDAKDKIGEFARM